MQKELRLEQPGCRRRGDQARTVLRARAAAGNPRCHADAGSSLPTTPGGLLGDLTPVASKEGWDKLVPSPLQKFDKYKSHWVAAPVNIHRTNWIWANKKIFDELKITPPKTFDELLVAADKIKKAGYIPLAHGGQRWRTPPSSTAQCCPPVVGVLPQGDDRLDPSAMGGKTMEKAFEQMRSCALWSTRTSRVATGTSPPRWSISNKSRYADHGRLGQGRIPEGGKSPTWTSSASSIRHRGHVHL
jgi:hypothetical protein